MGRILIWIVTLVGGLVLGVALARLVMPDQAGPDRQSSARARSATASVAMVTPRPTGDTTGAGEPAAAPAPAATVSGRVTPAEVAIAPASSPTLTAPPASTDTPVATNTAAPPAATATSPSRPAVTSTEAPAAPSDSSPSDPTALLSRVALAEETLGTGEFEATLNYGGGSQSAATILFDLGDSATEPRLHITTTYSGTADVQVLERIVIGAQSWQRESNGPWSLQATEESVWDQVQAYLPHAALVSTAERGEDEEGTFLEWYDESRDTDVTLHLDVESGQPLVLRQSSRGGGTTFTVIYRRWNDPVTIQPPPAY